MNVQCALTRGLSPSIGQAWGEAAQELGVLRGSIAAALNIGEEGLAGKREGCMKALESAQLDSSCRGDVLFENSAC